MSLDCGCHEASPCTAMELALPGQQGVARFCRVCAAALFEQVLDHIPRPLLRDLLNDVRSSKMAMRCLRQ
jgi:hypothetical protein